MANPPIVIGPFDNVPAPGSPIRSDWPQEISAYVLNNVVQVAGDTMTGLLNAQGGVQLASDASPPGVNAIRRDWADAAYMRQTGGTFTNDVLVNGPPDSTTPVAGIKLEDFGAINTVVPASVPINSANIYVGRGGSPAAGTGGIYIRFDRAGAPIGSITIASATSVAYNTTSDPRLKEVVEADNADAAARVQALGARGFKGRWVGDEAEGEVWDMLSAVDIAAVAPYAVQGEADATREDGAIDPMQVNYGSLVPLLVTALAQALDRIDALEAQ